MHSKVYFKNIKNEILEEIGNSKFSISVAVAWITDIEIIDKLLSCLRRGITVNVLSFEDKINGMENFKKLYFNGANVRLSQKLMHNKFCIIDNKTIISGSYNWTNNAKYNSENITVTTNNIDFAYQYQLEFDSLWKQCRSIDSKLSVNKENFKQLEYDFEYFLKRIRNDAIIPYLYYVPENVIINRNKYYDKTYGNLYSGYYLINTEDKEITSLKYIFYISRHLDIAELNKFFSKEIKLTSQRITSVITNHQDKLINIKSELWAEIPIYVTKSNSVTKSELFKISHKGEIDKEGYKIIGKIDKSYIIDIDGPKFLNLNGVISDFQKNQRCSNITNSSCFTPINNSLFLLSVDLHSEKRISNSALYDNWGMPIGRAIFQPNDGYSIESKIKNNFLFLREYPVAYLNEYTNIVTYCKSGIDSFVRKYWKIDLVTGSMTCDDKIEHIVTHSRTGKMPYSDKTKLFFFSDNAWGHFFMAMFLNEVNLKVQDFNILIKEYESSIGGLKYDNEKIEVATKLLLDL